MYVMLTVCTLNSIELHYLLIVGFKLIFLSCVYVVNVHTYVRTCPKWSACIKLLISLSRSTLIHGMICTLYSMYTDC